MPLHIEWEVSSVLKAMDMPKPAPDFHYDSESLLYQVLYVKIRVLKRNPPKEITIGKFEKMLED
jgi:hypothetical protein